MTTENTLTSGKHTKKEVGYAYASSPDAVRLGFGGSGCYTVSIGHTKQSACAGFATHAEAMIYADSLPYAHTRYSMTSRNS